MPHCLKNYKIPLEKKSPKNGATADKIDSWSPKFGLTSLGKKSQKNGASADKISSWSLKLFFKLEKNCTFSNSVYCELWFPVLIMRTKRVGLMGNGNSGLIANLWGSAHHSRVLATMLCMLLIMEKQYFLWPEHLFSKNRRISRLWIWISRAF